MKRVTKKNEVSGKYERAATMMPFNVLQRLGEYEDAEEQGMLVRLPLAVGTPVFLITREMGEDFEFYYNISKVKFDVGMWCDPFSEWKFGEDFFLTEDEALKALKEKEV